MSAHLTLSRLFLSLLVSSTERVASSHLFTPRTTLSHLVFRRAALFNQTKLIKFLLDKKAILNARDDEGRSAFLNAVAVGHVDGARDLLNRGADVSATDLLMKTCLHIAVENEHVAMLAMLLGRRPGSKDLNKRDVFDRVPLHYAAKTKDIKVITVKWYC